MYVGICYFISRVAPDGYSIDSLVRMPGESTAAEVIAEARRRGFLYLDGKDLTVWIDRCEDGCEDWEEVK